MSCYQESLDAWESGVQARRRGLARTASPFQTDWSSWSAWDLGWCEEDDRQKKDNGRPTRVDRPVDGEAGDAEGRRRAA